MKKIRKGNIILLIIFVFAIIGISIISMWQKQNKKVVEISKQIKKEEKILENIEINITSFECYTNIVESREEPKIKKINDLLSNSEKSINELSNMSLEDKNILESCKSLREELELVQILLEGICFNLEEQTSQYDKLIEKTDKELENITNSLDELKTLGTNAQYEECEKLIIECKYLKERMLGSSRKSLNKLQKKYNKSNRKYLKMLSEIKKQENRYQDFQVMIESLKQKLNSVSISCEMDMSRSYQFTVKELKYLILKSGKIQDEEILDVIAQVIKSTKMNEIFIISVMSLESYYFSSNIAKRNFNYGGLQIVKGKALTFSSKEEGLKASVNTIKNHINQNKKIYNIQKRYCPLNEHWDENVLSIMKQYASTKI